MPNTRPGKDPLQVLEDHYYRPRIGRRFSLRPGPFAPRQKQWKRYLPWQVWAEIDPAKAPALQAAFGIDADTPAGREQWETLIADLAHARLFLRVIRLHHRYRVPPGETRSQRQARLDRWLPVPFTADAATMRLTWKTPVRFACPSRSMTVKPRTLPLLVADPGYDETRATIQQAGGMARWLEDGQVFLCVKAAAPRPKPVREN